MQRLTTDLIGQASRIFLALAYPGGDSAIPAAKRRLLTLPADLLMFDHLATEPSLLDCCQIVSAKAGPACALLIRLGCRHYPNLKLKVQLIDADREGEWLFAVDTHDAYSATSFLPPPDHPDAVAWRKIQAANIELKEKIEAAWEGIGLLTFNGLLRRDLQQHRPSDS